MATRSRSIMKDTANVVFSYLQSDEAIQANQLAFMLRILRFSTAAGLVTRNQHAEFAANGYYLHHLYQAVSDSHSEAIAECMFGFLEAVPNASKPTEVGNSNAGYESLTEFLQNPDVELDVVEHFTARAKETQQLRVVFEMTSGKQHGSPFLREVLRALLVSEYVSKPPEVVRAKWSLIQDILKKEKNSQIFETFLKELPELHNLITSVIDNTFDVSESRLYTALIKNNAKANFVTCCANGLTSVGRDEWGREIQSQGDLVKLVIELKTRQAIVTLDLGYFDALVEYATRVAKGRSKVLPRSSWFELFGLLNDDHRELFPRRIYGILVMSNGRASTKFFDVFDGMLSNRYLLANEQRFIDQVCRPILDARNVRGLKWVAGIATSDPALFTGYDDNAAANDFKDRVRQGLSHTPGDDTAFPHLERIGTALDL